MENSKKDYKLEGRIKAAIAFSIASIALPIYLARNTFNYVAGKKRNDVCEKEYSLKPGSLAENFRNTYDKVMKDLQ